MNEPVQGLVSVITPVFNGDRFLAQAIESVRSQTYDAIELILVDDGSADNSRSIIKSFSERDRRLVPVLLDKNGGAARAKNHGLERARGEFVAFLDADDFWAPAKLEKQVRLLRENPDVGIVGTEGFVVNSEGVPGEPLIGRHDVPRGRISLSSFFFTGFPLATSAIAFRKACVTDCGGFKDYRKSYDYDFFLRITRKYDVDVIMEPLTYYRIHDSNMTLDRLTIRAEKMRIHETEILDKPDRVKDLGPEFLREMQRRYCGLGKMFAKAGRCIEARAELEKAVCLRAHPLTTLRARLYRWWYGRNRR